MPYAMRLSGWMGLVALTLASALFCTSGFLIVLGFERVSAGPKTFARLGGTGCLAKQCAARCSADRVLCPT